MPNLAPDDSDGSEDFAHIAEEDPQEQLAALSLRNQRKQIRLELTDPYNRLHSIALDAEFVKAVSAVYPDFAVVPNLRCGAWYVDPSETKTLQRDVYFKSIDGHAGQWRFPLRRPNLPFLDVIIEFGGSIIVDSTRRGKRFSDALSKTVPTWCAVINRAIFRKANGDLAWSGEDLDIYTSSESVSESERDQIRSRLDGWASDLLRSSYTLPALTKPLRPLHISPSSPLFGETLHASHFKHFYPVICLSASRYTSGGSSDRNSTFNYVPGSGDDHEGWVPLGFGPQHFWKHKRGILDCSRQELYELMTKLAAEHGNDVPGQKEEQPTQAEVYWIAGTNIGYCFVTSTQNEDVDSNTHAIHVGTGSSDAQKEETPFFQVPQAPKKHLSYFSTYIDKVEKGVAQALSNSRSVQIIWPQNTSSDQRDFGIGILLVALSLHFDDTDEKSQYVGTLQSESISKITVSRRLEWIITASNGKLNPSKGILKRVNDYLFSR